MKARALRILFVLALLTIASHIFVVARSVVPWSGKALALSPALTRPRLFGIAYVRISVADVSKARVFYNVILKSALTLPGQPPCDWCEIPPGSLAGDAGASGGKPPRRLGPIELDAMPTPAPRDLIREIGIQVDDVRNLRAYLVSRNFTPEKITKCGVDRCVAIGDPEGHKIVFVERGGKEMPSSPIIHSGFVVADRAAEDRFYKDTLGMHVYWQGGMKDNETNWVDMQFPDGPDWIEYMLGVGADADHHTLGVMNHIAIGVPDMKVAYKNLLAAGWKGTEKPQIGKDGKWQLNLYDPDDTRVELMEFRPTQKPCCSEYTGPHPGPAQ